MSYRCDYVMLKHGIFNQLCEYIQHEKTHNLKRLRFIEKKIISAISRWEWLTEARDKDTCKYIYNIRNVFVDEILLSVKNISVLEKWFFFFFLHYRCRFSVWINILR